MSRPKGAIAADRSLDAAELRAILKPVFQKLKKAGVPEERMPHNDAIISKLMSWIDGAKVDAWVKAYAAAMK